MSTPTAKTMIDTIKRALADTPAGTVSISVDGQTVTYDRMKAIAELKYWEQTAANETGRKPRVSRIDLSGF
jgi:hypothetical protein